MLVSLAFGLAAQSIVAVSPPVVRAAPRAPLASYVGRADYPVTARQSREEGAVAYTLIVGPDGRVAGCDIARSSGSSALDNATCRIMRSRARFTPARDASGRPTADGRAGELRWRLAGPIDGTDGVVGVALPAAPRLHPAVEPPRARASLASYVSRDDYPASALARGERGRVGFELAVGVDGRVTNCRNHPLERLFGARQRDLPDHAFASALHPGARFERQPDVGHFDGRSGLESAFRRPSRQTLRNLRPERDFLP